MSRRFARNGWPRASEIIGVTTFTGSATPHAEGAYTEIDASTAQNVCGLIYRVSADVATSGTDTSMLFTLATGAGGSEVDVVSNIAMGGATAGYRVHLPLHVPMGTRIAGKIRAEVVSDTLPCDWTLLFGGQMPGWGGYADCESLGADTANSRGTPISNSAGTYTQITAATTNPFRAISISFGIVDNTTTSLTQTVDVGVGAAASEVIVGTWTINTGAGEDVYQRHGPMWLETPIAAGSRIAVKKDGTADLSCVIHGWR